MALRAMLAALLLVGMAQAQEPVSKWGTTPLPDPAAEARAMDLMHELRCLTCQNQSIAESSAPQAEAMRALVREKLLAGESPETIRADLIGRYGDWVSFRPPARPDTWALWALPAIALAAGLLVVRRLFR